MRLNAASMSAFQRPGSCDTQGQAQMAEHSKEEEPNLAKGFHVSTHGHQQVVHMFVVQVLRHCPVPVHTGLRAGMASSIRCTAAPGKLRNSLPAVAQSLAFTLLGLG